ncbi:MAG: lipopolysaccharide biosynthesis protein [Rhizobiaceae bacterium]
MRFSAALTAERLLPRQLAAKSRPLFERIDAALFQPGEQATAGRMSLAAFVIRIISAVIAFVSQVLLARWMGGFEYGIFVLVWVTMVIVGNLSCLGVHTSVVRYVPEYLEKHKLAELRGILLASRIFGFVVSTFFAVLGAVGIWLLAPSLESYYLLPFYLGVICIPMIALSDVLQGIARANGWVMTALTPTYLIRPVLILVCMLGALQLGYPACAETAVIATIVATYATTLIQLSSIASRAENLIPPGPRKYEPKIWMAVSIPIFLVEGFFFLLTNADVLMVGWFMPPDDVAVYFATVKTLAVVHFVYFAVKAGVAQRYSHYAHAGDRAGLAAFARETATWTFWPSLLIGVAVLLVGEFLLSLFGDGFVAGYPLLFVLVAGVVARSSVGPAESVLTMSGNQNICAVVFAVALAINVGLNFILIPMFGLWGAAIATALAVVFEALALAAIVWQRLGIVMPVFLPARSAAEDAV